jgi:hypothetical protein
MGMPDLTLHWESSAGETAHHCVPRAYYTLWRSKVFFLRWVVDVIPSLTTNWDFYKPTKEFFHTFFSFWINWRFIFLQIIPGFYFLSHRKENTYFLKPLVKAIIFEAFTDSNSIAESGCWGMRKSHLHLAFLKFPLQFSSPAQHLTSELMQHHLLPSPLRGKHHCLAMGKFRTINCTTWKKGLIKSRYKTKSFFKPLVVILLLFSKLSSCLTRKGGGELASLFHFTRIFSCGFYQQGSLNIK